MLDPGLRSTINYIIEQLKIRLFATLLYSSLIKIKNPAKQDQRSGWGSSEKDHRSPSQF